MPELVDWVELEQTLDELGRRILAAIPDASYITIGRQDGEWCVAFTMPRRDAEHRVLHSRCRLIESIEPSFEEAISRAVRDAHYHRTGEWLNS